MRNNRSQVTGGLGRRALANNRCCEADGVGRQPASKSPSWEGGGGEGVGGRTFQEARNSDGLIAVAGELCTGEGEENQYRLVAVVGVLWVSKGERKEGRHHMIRRGILANLLYEPIQK